MFIIELHLPEQQLQIQVPFFDRPNIVASKNQRSIYNDYPFHPTLFDNRWELNLELSLERILLSMLIWIRNLVVHCKNYI